MVPTGRRPSWGRAAVGWEAAASGSATGWWETRPRAFGRKGREDTEESRAPVCHGRVTQCVHVVWVCSCG